MSKSNKQNIRSRSSTHKRHYNLRSSVGSAMSTATNEKISAIGADRTDDQAAPEELNILSLLTRLEGNQNIIIKEVFSQMNKVIAQLQNTNEFLLKENSELKSDVKSMKKRLDLTEGLVISVRKQNEQLNENVIDLKTRSMRDNLIFTGIPENENENTGETLKNFLKKEMKIPDVANLAFDRVHRMGPPGHQNRSIIAKMNPSSGKGKILANGRNLKGKQFRVFEQFPPEVQERRKRLMPLFKESKENPRVKKVSWSVDKLIVDGRVHSHKDAPLNIEPQHAEVMMEINHGEHLNEGGSTFQAHCIEISKTDEVPVVMANLMQNKALANATHNMFAYRIRSGLYSREGIHDDGEHGGARKIMEVLTKNDIVNQMVIVTRWYGGAHIGRKRFEAIETCTKNILKITDTA